MNAVSVSCEVDNVPYVGELCLVGGVSGLFYVGAVAAGPAAALATHPRTLAASLGLLAVAMGCMWYTQWTFGKLDEEVGGSTNAEKLQV